MRTHVERKSFDLISIIQIPHIYEHQNTFFAKKCVFYVNMGGYKMQKMTICIPPMLTEKIQILKKGFSTVILLL